MKNLQRILSSFLLIFALVIATLTPAIAAEEDIIILYTNDIHTYMANDQGEGNEHNLTYSKVAALKASLPGSILVDAGDHVQGTAYGGMDEGHTILQLMNSAGYDFATLGNHEFDYGMDGCLTAIQMADFSYLSCNFYHEKEGVAGATVLDSFAITESAGKKVAFIGITTPESITKSTPAYFQDEAGNYIYGIAGGTDGSALYASVQNTIDQADAAGADYIIALGHLGVDPSSVPWTSRDVIANTSGLDAFIDGHSHTTLENETVKDKNGDPVILTQTGSYFDAIGKMTIASDGTISTELLTGEDLTQLVPDAETQAIESKWIADINAQLGQIIGYTQVTLDNYDSEGNRLVRKQGTNTGDFSADALYYLFDEMDMDVDVAVMNGGGIRNTTINGELTYLSCKEIHTFGNVACLLTVSGQQLLDALEWGTYGLTSDGVGENGSLLHVSGLRYTVDARIPSTVRQDDKGVWTGGPTGEYRVKDVEIWDKDTSSYVPLDLTAKYNLAGYNYTLRDMGGGFAMLDGAVNVLDYVAEDYMVLANYIQSFPVDPATGLPTISTGAGYDNIYGDGRLTVLYSDEAFSPDTFDPSRFTSYTVMTGDSLWGIARNHYGTGTRWIDIYKNNKDIIQNPRLIRVGQILRVPIQ